MKNQLSLFAPAAPTIDGIDVRAAFASYSADRIGTNNTIRRPVSCNGDLWVQTGGWSKGAQRHADMYRCVPLAEFDGEPTTYNAKISIVREGDEYAGDYARSDPNGFYHGMAVKSGAQSFVLCGPPLALEVIDSDRGTLFDGVEDEPEDEDEDVGEQIDCSDCGVDLRQVDHYHDTPCGLFCNGCIEAHLKHCVECACELAAAERELEAAAR